MVVADPCERVLWLPKGLGPTGWEPMCYSQTKVAIFSLCLGRLFALFSAGVEHWSLIPTRKKKVMSWVFHSQHWGKMYYSQVTFHFKLTYSPQPRASKVDITQECELWKDICNLWSMNFEGEKHPPARQHHCAFCLSFHPCFCLVC